MCHFLSVIVLRNGDVLHHPLLDSHADLVTFFKLPDASVHHQHFAKAELTPTDDASWVDASKWNWRIDEPTRPGWLDDVESQAEAKARSIAQAMVLKGAHPLILEGCHIVPEGASVGRLLGGRLIRLCGGTVSAIWGGTVSAIRGGTVSEIRGGTVSAIRPDLYYGPLLLPARDAIGKSAELGKVAEDYYAKLKAKSKVARVRKSRKKARS